MSYKKLLLTICIITCILFTVSGVVAGDVTDAAISSDDVSSDVLEVECDESLEASLTDEVIEASDDSALALEAEENQEVLAGSNMDTQVVVTASEKQITTNPNSSKYDDDFIWVSVPRNDAGKIIVKIGQTTVFSKILKQFAAKNVQNEVMNGHKMKKYCISLTDLKYYKNFYDKFKTGDVMTVSYWKGGKEIEWSQYSLTVNKKAMNFKFKRMVDTMIECVDWHKKGSSNKAYFGLKNPKNDKPLSGYKLTIILDGKKHVKTTDKKGRVCLSFSDNSLYAKTYSITAKFAGNSKYVKSVETIKYTVQKSTKKAPAKTTPKLSAAKKTFNATVKNKQYTVTLKNSANKAISKVKLTLKVNGKTFKATTNSKGKATFKITNLSKKSTFKATVTFSGSSKYKKVSKSVNIICR